MRFTKAQIHSWCSDNVYQRGYTLYLKGKVRDLQPTVSDNTVVLSGSVIGSAKEPYSCEITLEADESGTLDILDYICDCPAYENWSGMCKHCAALCIDYSEQIKKVPKSSKFAEPDPPRIRTTTDFELAEILQYYWQKENDSLELPPGSLHIDVSLGFESKYDRHGQLPYAEIKAGTSLLYVIKNIPSYLHSVLHGTQYQYGKKLSVRHSELYFDADSLKILQILADAARESGLEIDASSNYYAYITDGRRLQITNAQMAALIRLCIGRAESVEIGEALYTAVDGDPPVTLSIHRTDGGALLSVTPICQICAEPDAIYAVGNVLYYCSAEFQSKALPFLHGIRAIGKNNQTVEKFLSESDFGRFSASLLPQLRQVMTVDEGDMDFTPFLPRVPEFCFYISDSEHGGISLKSEVCYGDDVFPLEVVGKEYRNLSMEKAVTDTIAVFFPSVVSPELREAVTEDDIYSILTVGIERLRELGTVFVDDALRSFRVVSRSTAKVGVSLHGNLIDVSVESEGYSSEEINGILDAYHAKKKYCRLKNGEFLSLTDGGLSVVAKMCSDLGLQFDGNGRTQTEAFRATYINTVFDRDDSGVEFQRDAAFREQIMALKNYRDEDWELPQALHASLRGYQRSGYRWLCALSSCSLGGILADDMGLGKTVQMLAYFLHLGGSFLVVCPASLIYNWESECRRFAPSIPCHIVRGTDTEKQQALANTDGLVITSYDQLRRDIELYKDKQFNCCVLDEAQYIRNAGTKAAKAVKQINALHRFALTGTPIENRLSDLWSIFDFLMPGYLFKYAEFKKNIEQPAVNGDADAGQLLTQMTAPFVLRRKKSDVLKELPDKQETVIYVEMTEQQRKIYDGVEQAIRLSLQKVSDAEYARQKLRYLSALTRLRQICCTPKLCLEGYTGGSGKVETCIELLTESAESGHRTLVFSQFTSMLELLISRADEAGLKWLYLSGKNTSEQRRDMVQQFQQGEYSVFFISLKAGGTGLNLTAADRVLHFDPWWNIAAEEQATDRAHRIGQNSKVLVTKLVCKDTIEERIIDLQERKRALSDMVMDNESISSAAIDRAELLQLLEGKY